MKKIRTVNKQLLGSILSLFVVALIVIFPGFMAQTIEDIETSQEGLKKYTEIISNNTTTTEYTPYMNNNNSNSRGMRIDDIQQTVNSCIQDRGNTADYEAVTVQYGVSGTTDILVTPSNSFTGANLYYYFWGDAQQMLTDGANIISIYVSMNDGFDYHLGGLLFVKLDAFDELLSYHSMTPPGWSTPVTNSHTFQYEIPTEDLQSGATTQSGASGDRLLMQMVIICEESGLSSKQIALDVEISPEYYEETQTTYNNTTSTTWEPYILGISNAYGWQKWSLGLGFFLIFGTVLIGTPWVNPSEWFSFPPSDKNGPRTPKRRIQNRILRRGRS